jgi:hypothetical protein
MEACLEVVGVNFRQECPMATSAQMSMTEYLHSTFEPDAEYVNGEIEERNVDLEHRPN